MKQPSQTGFTLVELMIVLVIVAVIAAVAYPAYTSQVQRTRMAEMQGYMTDLAASLEAWKSQNFSYEGATIADLSTQIQNSNHYNVVLNIENNGTTYEMRATPINAQAGAGHMRRDSQGRTCVDLGNDSACDLADVDQRWSK